MWFRAGKNPGPGSGQSSKLGHSAHMVEEFVLMTFVYYLVAEPPPPTTKARNLHAPIKVALKLNRGVYSRLRQEDLMRHRPLRRKSRQDWKQESRPDTVVTTSIGFGPSKWRDVISIVWKSLRIKKCVSYAPPGPTLPVGPTHCRLRICFT